VTCLTVVMIAGVTAVLIHPLAVDFGWDREVIAFAVSPSVFLYGLAGSSTGWVMLRVGPRCVILFSLLLWSATVPPTDRLAWDIFGKHCGPILFGWVFFGHQVVAMFSPPRAR
jgi:hypothetical protein